VDQETIFVQIKEVLQELVEDVDLSKIGLDTSLREHLDVDSGLALNVAYQLGQRFENDIPFELWFVGQGGMEDFTIRSLTAFVQKHT